MTRFLLALPLLFVLAGCGGSPVKPPAALPTRYLPSPPPPAWMNESVDNCVIAPDADPELYHPCALRSRSVI